MSAVKTVTPTHTSQNMSTKPSYPNFEEEHASISSTLENMYKDMHTLRTLQYNKLNTIFKQMSDEYHETKPSSHETHKVSNDAKTFNMNARLFLVTSTKGTDSAKAVIPTEKVNTCNYIVSIAPGNEIQKTVLQQLRLIVSDDCIWKAGDAASATVSDRMRKLLKYAVTKRGFTCEWTAIGPTFNADFSQSFDSLSATPILCKTIDLGAYTMHVYNAAAQTTVSDNIMDDQTHDIRRCAKELQHVMNHFHVSPKLTVVHLNDSDNKTSTILQITTTLTVQNRRHAMDIESPTAYVHLSTQPISNEPKRRMICVNSIGIRNDHASHNVNLHKKLSMCEIGWVPHKRFGVHDIQFIRFAAPEVYKYARRLGEIHFMTQIVKSILKTRNNPSDEVREVTAEQRGVHLKDESKLCAYWSRMHELLDKDERKCFNDAIVNIRNGTTKINVSLKDGYTAQACTHIGENECGALYEKNNSNTSPMESKVQDIHHLNVLVNIKASTLVPISKLRRECNKLNVRIDNDWELEMNTVADQ